MASAESLSRSSSLQDGAGEKTCDNCKKKKVKCTFPDAFISVWHTGDPGLLPSNDKCLNCSIHLLDCTYKAEEPKKRRRPRGHIEELQWRIKELEGALRKVCPDEKLLKEIYARVDEESDTTFDSEFGHLTPLPGPSRRVESVKLVRKITRSTIEPEENPFKDDANDTALKLGMLPNIREEGGHLYGHPGITSLIRTAISFQKGKNIEQKILASERTHFRERKPWEPKIGEMTPIRYTFPQQDLMDELVNAYFEHVNLIMPLLHRPTFDRSVAQGLHLHDNGFGGVLLLVCAIGSKYIRVIDERVMLDGVDSPFSAGYKWFNQVNVVKDKLLAVPNVYDIQMYALACQFLQGTSIPHTCWTLVGIGIRFSQDLGIHRRRVPLEQLTVELELCKRAFWVLVSLDQMASIGLGRACAVDNRALDLDMPIECDDEYWEHEDPKKRFRQPTGKPTTISAFNHQLRLNRIMVFALRSLYHMKRKAWDFILKDWQKPVVEEMDSALNKWLVDVPECVRWDPHRSDDKFYKVSSMLMGWYYYVQILIHRPFILSRDKTSHPFPSLTICSNAAKATSNLIDAYRKKGYPIHVHLTLFAFTSGVVLILNRREKSSTSGTRGVDDIHKCLDLLKFSEERWYSCGKAWDTLNGLVSAQEHDNSESSSETGSTSVAGSTYHDSYVGMATPQTRVTDRNRQLNNGDMRFDSVSYQSLLPSYHVESGTATESSSTYAVPHLPTSIPGNAYLIPPEGVGTLDPRHFGSYSYPSSAVFYDTNEQLPLSSADFRLLPAADVPDMPPGMDSNTMNMWMNAPTGISLEDWVEFLGEYNYGKRSNL